MKRRLALALIVVAVLIGVGIGYFADTALNATKTDACTTLSSLQHSAIPIGFEPKVSYPGDWRVSIATFAGKADNVSALSYVCTYHGSGSDTFYVTLAGPGWNTIAVLAHKLGSSGTLSVEASMGNVTSTNSTSQSYGSAVITISYYFGS